MYKERKETTHGEIGEIVITTSSNIYIYMYISIKNTKFAITKWSQDQWTRTKYLKDKEKKKKHTKSPYYIPHKQKTLPLTKACISPPNM